MGTGSTEVIVGLALILGFCVFLLAGNRPTPDRFATANGLTLDDATRAEVAAALRRTYRGRLLGGGAGLLIALSLAALGGTRLNFTGGLTAVLAGTLIGISVAQFARTPVVGSVRIASLQARDPDDYRPHKAKVTMGVALGLLLGCGAIAAVSLHQLSRVTTVVIFVVVVALAAVALGTRLQRRIVEQSRDRLHPDHSSVDRALRASAVRAVHHATMGMLLCGIALLGVTIATPTSIRVYSDRSLPTDHASFLFEIPAGSTDISSMSGSVVSTIDWTDADGVTHHRELPVTPADHHVLTWESHFGVPWGAVAFVTVLGLLAGIGALLEWRAAARAWRRPDRASHSAGTSPLVAIAGGIS